MISICVFLGSNIGKDNVYARAARELGLEIGAKKLDCVYGGSNTGLMKILADSVLEAGGRITGVTIGSLRSRQKFHPNLTRLHVVPTLHERKALMEKLSDAFIALPGGVGTFEEFFEVYTLTKLKFHSKPLGLLNINNYYAPLKTMLENAKSEGFLKKPYQDLVTESDNPPELIDLILKKI